MPGLKQEKLLLRDPVSHQMPRALPDTFCVDSRSIQINMTDSILTSMVCSSAIRSLRPEECYPMLCRSLVVSLTDLLSKHQRRSFPSDHAGFHHSRNCSPRPSRLPGSIDSLLVQRFIQRFPWDWNFNTVCQAVDCRRARSWRTPIALPQVPLGQFYSFSRSCLLF